MTGGWLSGSGGASGSLLDLPTSLTSVSFSEWVGGWLLADIFELSWPMSRLILPCCEGGCKNQGSIRPIAAPAAIGYAARKEAGDGRRNRFSPHVSFTRIATMAYELPKLPY